MVDALLKKVTDLIVTPLLTLLFAVAFIVFVWGVFQYFIYQSDSSERGTGAQHILWGVIGMAIMLSAYGIINFVISTLNTI